MRRAFIVALVQIVAGFVIGSTSAAFAQADARPGTLTLTIVDGDSGQPTPARVELLDKQGRAYVARDALLVAGDCEMHYGGVAQEDARPWTLERALSLLTKEFHNPYTGTTQFYSAGKSVVSLPPGAYKLKVFKGNEYEIQAREVDVRPGETTKLTLKMARWVQMPEQGWYSADDHIHIARPVKELDPFISKMMQAEDLHVGNLLQMGFSKRPNRTPQYAHGPEGIYQEGNYILASGQENPRTHFLGHTITMGEQSEIHFPEHYLIYRLFFEEARRQGALSGYAHWAFGHLGGPYGLSVDLPHGLVSFLEVLQFNRGIYNTWYEILNTGFRMTPTAGTDYPCAGATIPGRERFYTKVQGPFTFKNWLEGVRRGQTFVTNGPILEFQVNGKGMGEEVVLGQPGPAQLEGRVRFDPASDDVEHLEVIENGHILRSFPRAAGASEIRFKFEHNVQEASWLAVRAFGNKVDEPSPVEGRIPGGRVHGTFRPNSEAHSAPVYITVKGAPPLKGLPRAKALARTWLARLEDLEFRLAEDQIPALAKKLEVSRGDIVEEDLLRKNRVALLEEIQKAKEYFTRLAR